MRLRLMFAILAMSQSPNAKADQYIGGDVNIGVAPRDLVGVYYAFDFTNDFRMNVGTSLLGARRKSLGFPIVSQAEYFFSPTTSMTGGVSLFSGSGSRSIKFRTGDDFEEKSKVFRGCHNDNCTYYQGDKDPYIIGDAIDAEWSMLYTSIGMRFRPSTESKLSFNMGLSLCPYMKLKVKGEAEKFGDDALGIVVDGSESIPKNATAGKGDIGVYLGLGYDFDL